MYKHIYVLLVFALLINVASADEWVSDSSIVTGLGDVGSRSTPQVYNDSGIWKLIAGDNTGGFNGFTWNGTSWISNASIIAGLGDVGSNSAPCIYEDFGTWKLISTESGIGYSTFDGFQWNGTYWVSNASIVTGLSSIGGIVEIYVTVYNASGTFNLIHGSFEDGFFGFQWNGSAWVPNSSIATGLDGVGEASKPRVYYDSGTWKLISGNCTGVFHGFDWNGTSWVSNASIVAGLTDVGDRSSATVYNDSGVWKLIAGENTGVFYGWYYGLPTTTFYVTNTSPGGGDGSWSNPWNLTEGFSNAVAGDTVLIQGGIYDPMTDAENYISVTNAGTAGNMITFQSDNGTAIFKGEGLKGSTGPDYGITIGHDYIEIKDIHVKNCDNGIKIASDDCKLTNVSLYSHPITMAGGGGVSIFSGSSNIIQNCDIYNNSVGVYVHDSSSNMIQSCDIYNNTHGTFARYFSTNNTLLNCDFDTMAASLNDTTSQWIIKYTNNQIIGTDDPALSMTCYADNCTMTIATSTDDYTLDITTLDVTVSADTGSVSVAANSTLVNIDYTNSSINDLNITSLDRQLTLESAGVQTMVFNPTNVFNLWNFEYYVNATSNRKAVSFDTYTTNATNLINFIFYDLYPSSNFDCKYNSVSFTTNTSGTTGTLEFNKSSWTANVTRSVEIYAVTTPYRCEGGMCWTYEGDAMVIYLNLNDSTVQGVQAEVTTPSGTTTNTTMTDFIDNGMTTWRLDYEGTGIKGTYTVDNFYSDRGSGWEQLDSFLSFESRLAAGGGSGSTLTDTDDGGADGGAGGGGGAQPEPEPEDHSIKPDKQFSSGLTGGRATFTGSIVTRVITEQSGTVEVDEFKINPTTTSLIGGTRYGYADIQVPDRNIGGTICFYEPTTDTAVSLYHLEDNEWVELKTRNVNGELCADTGHFSYFAIAEGGMESVIESMTQLSLTPPKVSGVLVWKWLSDTYTSTHIANRELMNVSSSEGMICEILTTGDYANRTLKCTYAPPEGEEWTSLKYTGEIVAIDTQGYTKRIPVAVQVYDMDKLGFPVFMVIILLGGIILYQRY